MNYLSLLKTTVLFLLLSCAASIFAESITYNVVKDDDLKYVIKPFGTKPAYSYAEFNNEFGNIIGNRYNQIPKDKKAELYLVGWEGCTIKSITFNMCSNAKSGGASIKVMAGTTSLFNMGSTAFNSPQWYGSWVSHINYVYVDVTKTMTTNHVVQPDEDISIVITGTESSVYINSYTIEYEPSATPTESAMGYQYEKVGKNGTIVDGDDILIYYSGVAAGDIDTTQTYPYMDVYSVHNILDVYEPEFMYFKLRKNGTAWNLVNQYSDTLGATAAKKLAWNKGGMDWNIALTFDGAEIANTNTDYGTLRFNQPDASYARITNYTSTTTPLPYIYKRVKQNQPIVATSLTLRSTLNVSLCQDTAILRATILPATATDKRTTWKSSDEAIATVADGIVRPVSIGSVDIIVFNSDSTLTDTCRVSVSACPVSVTGVTLDSTQLTLNMCGTQTFTLVATVLPQDAAIKTVMWESSNEAVAAVTAGTVTAVAAGTATITATTTDGGFAATCAVTVEECGSGLHQVVIAGVYTSQGKIRIEQNMPVDVTIYNVLGQLMISSNQVQNAEFVVQQGVYLVKIGNSVMKVAVK